MSHDLVLIVAMAISALLFISLRINAAMVFLSLCLGEVLVLYASEPSIDLLKMMSSRGGDTSATSLLMALLFVPAIVTSIVTVVSIHGKVKVVLNAIPAIAASALAVVLAVPSLSPGLRYAIESGEVWDILNKADAMIVGVGAMASLFFLWTQRRSFRQHDKKKH